MPRNIEIKARIESVEAMMARAAALADRGPAEIHQDDTFFACPRGRLKLRALSPTEGQLIFYQRPDQAGPKESFFVVAPTMSPDEVREALSLAYGQIGRVRKRRTLYLVGRTRVHLDRVEHLGDFLDGGAGTNARPADAASAGRRLKHDPEKWKPLFRKRSCFTKKTSALVARRTCDGPLAITT